MCVVGHGAAFGLPPPRSEEVAVQQERIQQLQLGLPRVCEVSGGGLTMANCVDVVPTKVECLRTWGS